MNIVAIIQARTGSTRLPGKVLTDLAGEPMLARVVARVARAARVDRVAVATTVEAGDDAIEALCASRGWPCFRGSVNDVLDRYHRAALALGADVVVRVGGDCPLADPAVVDAVVDAFLGARPPVDYACNDLPRPSFPLGLDVEVVGGAALARAWEEDTDPASREHVTPHIRAHPERFRLLGVAHDEDLSRLRWTVDEPADLELARRVYTFFGHDRFGWREIVRLLARHPDWVAINQHVRQRKLPGVKASR